MARPKKDVQRREEILRAFEACVVRKGLAHTTLSDVAEEAKLPRSLARYFLGNRDEIVALLIERMVARAEASLVLLQKQEGKLDAPRAVDFLFDELFANDTSNAIVEELWVVARRDERIRTMLRAVYVRLATTLSAIVHQDARVCATKTQIEGVVFTVLALVYGDASFRMLGMKVATKAGPREQAQRLMTTLMQNPGVKR